MRPRVELLTEVEAKNDYAMDEMDFGVCNVDRHRVIKLYLSNVTPVTAKWALNYVKFPKKTTVSKYTETHWEEENQQKVDDPDVFEFSVSGVSTPALTLLLLGIASRAITAATESARRTVRAAGAARRRRAKIVAANHLGKFQAKAKHALQVKVPVHRRARPLLRCHPKG